MTMNQMRRRCRLTLEEPELQYLKERLERKESPSYSEPSKCFPSTANCTPPSNSGTVTEPNNEEGEKSKVTREVFIEVAMKSENEKEGLEKCEEKPAFSKPGPNVPTDERKLFGPSYKVEKQRKREDFVVHDWYDAAPVTVCSKLDIKSDFEDKNIEGPTEGQILEQCYGAHALSSKPGQKVKGDKEDSELVVTSKYQPIEVNVQVSSYNNEKQFTTKPSKVSANSHLPQLVREKVQKYRSMTTDQYFQLKPLDVQEKDGNDCNTKKFAPRDETLLPEQQTTLRVNNLNYTTTEGALKRHFSQYGDVYDVAIPKKYEPNNLNRLKSMGYAFAQFFRAEDARKALLESLRSSYLDARRLAVMRSTNSLVTENAKANNKKRNATKLLVRNIPFQATEKQINDLFKLFGALKSVILPKKITGEDECRGFAFIEYWSPTLAKNAFEKLSKGTHFFNQRLVIEMAFEDEKIRKPTKKSSSTSQIEKPQPYSTKTYQDEKVVSDADMESLEKYCYAMFYGKDRKKRIRDTKTRYNAKAYIDHYFNFRRFLASSKNFCKIVEEDEENC